ncbi:hypothetical protein K501DRAFT_276728 [Backusella circina FSU 941]|nr:hypothetical protein K501DRAFT_276728 [Backusella circina FSU 941]
MLESLPIEIILQITRNLGFYSKLNLIQTCRTLHQKLYQTAVFEDLIIPNTHTDRVIELFKHNRLDGKKVKRLTVDLEFAHKSHFLELSKIFPNLAELYTDRCVLSAMQMKQQEINSASGLRHSLQMYDIERCHESISLLFENNVFHRLTCLCLRSFTYTMNGNYALDLDRCLMNTPMLVSLKLIQYNINITLLEGLHKARPGIVSLELSNAIIGIDNDTNIVSSVVPLGTFKSLKIKNSMQYQDTDFLLLDYIMNKYTNLETLDIDDLLNLRDCNTLPNPHGSQNERFHRYMRKNMPRLLPRLKILRVPPRLFGDYMDDVYLSPNQLVEIGFYSGRNTYDSFKDLRDLECIQRLCYLQSLTVEIKIAKCLYHHDVILPNITYMHLYDKDKFNASFFSLDRLMFTYRGLKRLIIDSINTTISIANQFEFTVYPSLHTLTLNVYDIKLCVSKFINEALPKITKISWSTKMLSEETVLSFPSHTLKSLQLYVYGKDAYLKPDTTRIIRYEIHTKTGTKFIDYVSRSRFERKVLMELDELDRTKYVNVIVLCQDIHELLEDNVIIFN